MNLLLRCLVAVAVALLAAVGPASAQPGVLTPEQREQLWRQMTPEQKGNVIRQLTPEQREGIRERMTPEQRDQFRQRMREQREQRMLEGGAHRLSPEQRQRLREQIYESNRGFRGPGERPMKRGPQGGQR